VFGLGFQEGMWFALTQVTLELSFALRKRVDGLSKCFLATINQKTLMKQIESIGVVAGLSNLG
jgi:hypothetical protein